MNLMRSLAHKLLRHFKVDWWCRNYSLVLDSTTTVDVHVAYGSEDQMASVIVKEGEQFLLHVVAPVVGATKPAFTLEFGTPKTCIRVNLVCVVSVAAD